MRDDVLAADLKRHTEATFKRGVARGRVDAFEEMKPTIDKAYNLGRSVRRKEIITVAVWFVLNGIIVGFTIALAAVSL